MPEDPNAKNNASSNISGNDDIIKKQKTFKKKNIIPSFALTIENAERVLKLAVRASLNKI